MTNQLGIKGLGLAILCAAMSGCVSPYAYYCDDGCGPTSLSGRYAACDEAPAGDCDTAPCGAACGCPTLGCLRNIFGCNAGCGRVYWGEWAYDPPEACDPCNDCGEWVGPQDCRPCGLFNCWGLLWGARFQAPCGSPACATCADTVEVGCGGEALPGEVLDGEWTETIESIETVPDSPAMESVDPTLGTKKPAGTRDPNSRLVRRSRSRIVH